MFVFNYIIFLILLDLQQQSLREAVQMGIYFSVYDKVFATAKERGYENNNLTPLLGGGFCSICVWTVTMPLDIAKSSNQNTVHNFILIDLRKFETTKGSETFWHWTKKTKFEKKSFLREEGRSIFTIQYWKKKGVSKK